MKKTTLLLFINLVLTISVLAQVDTLDIKQEINSPTKNPWSLAGFDKHLWLGEGSLNSLDVNRIFKINLIGEVVDTFEFKYSNISGLDFVNDTMYILQRDYVYKYDYISNQILDSIYYKLPDFTHLNSMNTINGNLIISIGYHWKRNMVPSHYFIAINPSSKTISYYTKDADVLKYNMVGLININQNMWVSGIQGNWSTTTLTKGAVANNSVVFTDSTTIKVLNYLSHDFYFDNGFLWAIDLDNNKINKHLFEKQSSIVTNNSLKFEVFPNPTSNILHINTSTKQLEKLLIYNSRGQIILQQNNPLNYINISVLKKGIYIIQINEGNQVKHQKFIKI